MERERARERERQTDRQTDRVSNLDNNRYVYNNSKIPGRETEREREEREGEEGESMYSPQSARPCV